MGQSSRQKASTHKAMSYGRMLKQERDLEAESDRLFREAEQIDFSDDTNLDEEQGADSLSDDSCDERVPVRSRVGSQSET